MKTFADAPWTSPLSQLLVLGWPFHLQCSFSSLFLSLSFCRSCSNTHPNQCQHVKPTSAHTRLLRPP